MARRDALLLASSRSHSPPRSRPGGADRFSGGEGCRRRPLDREQDSRRLPAAGTQVVRRRRLGEPGGKRLPGESVRACVTTCVERELRQETELAERPRDVEHRSSGD